MFRRSFLHDRLFDGFPWSLFVMVNLISFVGLIAIYSASHNLSVNYALKQAVWLAVATAALFMVVWVGYRRLLGYAYSLYVISLILLILVFAII